MSDPTGHTHPADLPTHPAGLPAGDPPAEAKDVPVLGRGEHRFRFLAPLLLSAFAMLSGLFAYWALDSSPPVENMTGKVVSAEVAPDGSARLVVEWMAIRRRLCHGNSVRWIIDGYITPLPDIQYPPPQVGEIGQVIRWRVPITVPKDFHDVGVYRVHVEYTCNPLQRIFPIVIDPPDVPFAIDRSSRPR
jgi:hypothetical protein